MTEPWRSAQGSPVGLPLRRNRAAWPTDASAAPCVNAVRTQATERPWRVLFAIPALDSGGPDRVFFDLIRALDRKRFKPILVTFSEGGRYFSLLPDDVERHALKVSRGWFGKYPVLSFAAAVRRIRPDLVISTLMNLTALLSKPLFPRNVPLVIRQANQLSENFDELVAKAPVKHRLSRRLLVWSYRWADAIVCQSNSMRDDLADRVDLSAKVVVIDNPIDVDCIRHWAGMDRVVVRGRPALVGVGRLAPQKGYDILLLAFSLVLQEFPEAHLTLIGEGPEKSDLQRLACSLQVADAVTFAGFRANPYAYMRQADLFVSASRYEGFANVLLEALACGTPVVATDCPGAAREVVREGMTGWLAEAHSPDSLASAICKALTNASDIRPDLMEAFCRERFSLEKVATAYEDLVHATILGHERA